MSLPEGVLTILSFWLGVLSKQRIPYAADLPTDVERKDSLDISLAMPDGTLNKAAIGWSRHATIDASLAEAPLMRRKYWNYWAVTDASSGLFFAVTVADLDYIGLLSVDVYDRTSGAAFNASAVIPLGLGGDSCMPGRVFETVRARGRGISVSIDCTSSDRTTQRISVRADRLNLVKSGNASHTFLGTGSSLSADIEVVYPANSEQLHVVVPWSSSRFQFTAKHNTLPASGSVTISLPGDGSPLVYKFDSQSSFACLDYGRGVWPAYSRWNWSSFSGWDKSGQHRVGLNLGGKWTDGTGTTENAVCIDGRLYRINGPAEWVYDTADWMKPWRLTAPTSADHDGDGALVELVFTPSFDRFTKTNAIVIFSQVHQMLGTFEGTIRAGSKEFVIRDVFGWAEEHIALW